MPVNGKSYPLWEGIAAKAESFIGGTLKEICDSSPRLTEGGEETIITDVRLLPNGDTSAKFEVSGKDFSCSGDVQYLGITAGESGWLTFLGFGGHTWAIREKQ